MATTRHRSTGRTPRPVIRATTITLMTAAALTLSTAPGQAAPSQGLVRLAHLSPDTPAVDVYLYTAGKKTPRLVLRHVGYGALSPYQKLGGGSYTVAMRPADAAATSKPVLSTTVQVQGGGAYTVAGMGPYKGIKLKVLNDSTSLSNGSAGLRVIAASLKEPAVDVTAAGRPFTKGLRFSNTTPYRQLPAKATEVQVQGRSGSTDTTVKLVKGSVHTVVVLDGDAGLKLVALRDAAQPAAPPSGGVDTGLGGQAAKPAATPAENNWQLYGLLTLTALVCSGGAIVVVRRRRSDHG